MVGKWWIGIVGDNGGVRQHQRVRKQRLSGGRMVSIALFKRLKVGIN